MPIGSASSTAAKAVIPTASQLYSQVSTLVRGGGISPALIPKTRSARSFHPFVKVLREVGQKSEILKEEDARAALRAFFVSMPDNIITALPKSMISGMESILRSELADSEITDANQLIVENVPSKTQYPVAVWRGDMTRLRCGAMVNPANGDLLGCFLPSHRCLDNIIMAQAGPQLRVACKQMKHDLNIDWDDNGQCRVTPAFELPAKYVFHTVGPDLTVRDPNTGAKTSVRKPTEKDERELKSCYQSCIRTASEKQVASVAFCCISTGIFGYPNEEAAPLALKTTKDTLDGLRSEKKFIPSIIFNTFLEKDHKLYLEGFEKFFAGQKF